MNTTEFEKYLSERYKKQRKWYSDKAAWNKTRYQMLQWVALFFGALTPVLIALRESLDPRIPWHIAALCSSALVVFASSVLKAFKYQETWLNYRTTSEVLKKELYFYQARVHAYSNTASPEQLFVSRVEAIVSRENALWVDTVTAKEKPPAAFSDGGK
ncbi:MAG: DUF4231 domain-containing protein [Phycisphaerales bacterium]|nr:MAG: DUF4231 domain-containing protein [Phycisphaerales bacterium]